MNWNNCFGRSDGVEFLDGDVTNFSDDFLIRNLHVKIVLIGTTLGLLLIGLVTGNGLTAQDPAALEQSEKQRVLAEVLAVQTGTNR